MSLRDDILALRPETKAVETAVGPVWVRGMTIGLKDAIQRAAADGRPWRGIMLAHCVVDDAGVRLFTDDDIPKLHEVPAHMERVIDAALELSAFSNDEVEELEKN